MKVPSKRFSGFREVLRDTWMSLWSFPFSFAPLIFRLLGLIIIGVFMLGIVWILAGPHKVISEFSLSTRYAVIGLFVFLALAFEFLVKSLQINIFSHVAHKKHFRLKKMFLQSFYLYSKVFLNALVIVGVGIISFAFIYALFVLSTSLADLHSLPFWMSAIIGLIALGGFILVLLFTAFVTFWMPLIFFSKKKIVFKDCFLLFKKDGRFVWSIYLIKLGIGLGIGMILAVISAIIKGQFGFVPLWWDAIHFILDAILMTWLSLFTFRSFAVRYKIKVND